jgi:hypothetical protein
LGKIQSLAQMIKKPQRAIFQPPKYSEDLTPLFHARTAMPMLYASVVLSPKESCCKKSFGICARKIFHTWPSTRILDSTNGLSRVEYCANLLSGRHSRTFATWGNSGIDPDKGTGN